MVSIGTIITLGVIAAITAGGYAVYRNVDPIRGAVSRGVETNLVNPLRDWADSLWSGIAAVNENISDPDPSTSKSTKFYDPSKTVYTPTGKTQQQVLTQQPNLIPVKTTTTRTPAYRPSTAYKAGYYYFDVKGSKYDTQQFLSAERIKQIRTSDPTKIFHPEGLREIKYIGKTPLQKAGFELFGRSQNYL